MTEVPTRSGGEHEPGRVELTDAPRRRRTDLYQLPLSSTTSRRTASRTPSSASGTASAHYDAVHDREAMQRLAAGVRRQRRRTSRAVAFSRIADHELDLDAHSTLFSGEQSNSSVAFGEDSLLKVFRRITPGTNPDIEIHEALTRAGSTPRRRALRLRRGPTPTRELHLAMLQQFLRTASDGWELALASARNLFTEGDLHADEVGGDFAAEAYRLGADAGRDPPGARRRPSAPSRSTSPSTAQAMRDRLDCSARRSCPELGRAPGRAGRSGSTP